MYRNAQSVIAQPNENDTMLFAKRRLLCQVFIASSHIQIGYQNNDPDLLQKSRNFCQQVTTTLDQDHRLANQRFYINYVLADCLASVEQWEQAIALISEAIDLFQDFVNRINPDYLPNDVLALMLSVRLQCENGLGLKPRSIGFSRQLEQVMSKLGNTWYEASVNQQLVVAYSNAEQHQRALKIAKRSSQILKTKSRIDVLGSQERRDELIWFQNLVQQLQGQLDDE